MSRYLWIVVVLVAAVGGWRWYEARKAPKTVTAWEPYTVDVGRLKDAIPCDGVLQPQTKTEVKSRVGGEIVSLGVEEGQTVLAGALLAQLDTEQLVQSVRQADANLRSAKAQLALAERGWRPEEKLNQESRVAEATISRDQAVNEFNRVKDLYDRGFASEQELEQAQESRSLRQQDLDLANSLLSTLNEGGIVEDREVARASVIRNQAILATAEEELSNATVRAPISGTILSLPVEVGTTVSSGVSANSGGTVIATIGDMGTLQLEGTVDESDIGRVIPGLPCEVTTDAYPDLVFKGTVERIAPQAVEAQNVSTFKVEIKIDTANPTAGEGGSRFQFKGTFEGAKGRGGRGGGNPGKRQARGIANSGGGGRPSGKSNGSGAPSGSGGDTATGGPLGDLPEGKPKEEPVPVLRAGLSATAEILISSYDEAPVIPIRFLQYGDDGKPFVMVWPEGVPAPEPPDESDDKKKKAKPAETKEGPQPIKTFVEIGYTDGVSYAIKSGLKPGDIVVAEQEVEMEASMGAFGLKQKAKK
ncbi:MAG: HlyD family efflux transporter periplasmic adaptor subunit [bacterium]